MSRSYTPRERFVRLCEKRTQVVLDDLDILLSCFVSPKCEWSEEDLIKVLSAIECSLDAIRSVPPYSKGFFFSEDKP